MPPKKPVSKKPVAPKKAVKPAAKAPAKKPAKAVAKSPVKAAKQVSKPVAKKAVPASVAVARKISPAVQKSVITQPAPKSAPQVPGAEKITPSAGWVATPKQTFERNDIFKLTFAYLWRSWLLALTWGMVATVAALAVETYKLPYQTEAWVIAGYGVDFVISLSLSIIVFGWLASEPRLLGGIKLAATLTNGARRSQVILLWFSFLWRSILLMLAGFIVYIMLVMVVAFSSATFPFISMVLGYAIMAALFFYSLLVVPYLVWLQLLKKQTFSWGKLELLRVKS